MPLEEIIKKLSEQMLRRLGPGDLAELRRMTPEIVAALGLLAVGGGVRLS